MSDEEFEEYGYGSGSDSEGEWNGEDIEEYGVEGELRAEVNVFDRIGGVGDLMITSDLLSQDPTDRFKLKVNAISRELNNNRHINLGEEDIKILIEKVIIIKEKGFNIDFINPTAYILGYIVSMGGQKIEKTIVDLMFANVLKLVLSVSKADVIRYARFHINLEN